MVMPTHKITPKAKVWKVKKKFLKNWSHKTNRKVQAFTITKTQGTKIRGKPTTIGMVDLKPNR